jgi:cytochrome c oxidase subunit II
MSGRCSGTSLIVMVVVTGVVLGGCDGAQSTLSPQGPEADRVRTLFFVLTGGGVLILLGVIWLTALALYSGADRRRQIAREGLIIGGGIVFPVVTLTALLAYGVVTMRAAAAPPASGSPFRISVTGEQWWWRVKYMDSGGRGFESANELRIPVERPVEIELASADVIHSFWAPRLAGKLDMIPGRKTTLRLAATSPGVSRGQCAEYCGGAHALMSFYVVAMEQAGFDAWLQQESGPAVKATESGNEFGQMLLIAHGCGGCHAIRGTSAVGRIGPDLTHVGGRLSLGAAALPNDADAIARWIVHNQHIKPKNRMPPYGIFSPKELAALSSYLASLK